jgi:hypothetical protein
VTWQAGAYERLAAEQASALERLNGLERELRGIIESADTAGTDDEHDPEGATIAGFLAVTAGRRWAADAGGGCEQLAAAG